MLASLSPVARYAVKLYFRCLMFKEIALPQAGGVLDQDDFVVSMLETVHSYVIARHNREHEKIVRKGSNPAPSFQGIDRRDIENTSIGGSYNRRIG